MIDEKQDGCFLDVVVCVACPARCLEPQLGITDLELNKLVGYSSSMNLTDSIRCACVGGN